MPAKAGIHDFAGQAEGIRSEKGQERKRFFFEKKKQKTFGPAGFGKSAATARE